MPLGESDEGCAKCETLGSAAGASSSPIWGKRPRAQRLLMGLDFSNLECMWLLQPVVNACLQILLCIGAGYVLTRFRIISTAAFVPQSSILVLYLCFPCLNLYYLGIQTDLTQADNWLILSASIIWTLFAQIIIVTAVFFFKADLLKSFGGNDSWNPSDLTTARIRCAGFINLCLTSDNTVLVGLPLVTSVFGATGAKVCLFLHPYPAPDPPSPPQASLLTIFPIFLLSIPFSVVAFEWERARLCNVSDSSSNRIEQDPTAGVEVSTASTIRLVEPKTVSATAIVTRKILLNPVVWSLLGSIVVSVSTIGPKYLKESSPSFVIELGWIASTTKTIASVAVPLSLISQGSWMESKPLSLKAKDSEGALLLTLVVLRSIFLPLLQLVVARFIVPLDAHSGMSLVLLTVCPVASSCFVIATEYGRGQSVITTLTVLGTLLLLPLSLMILYLPQMMGLWQYQIGR